MLENRALEIIIIALVVLVLFGAKRLPDSARALGKSLRILKAETRALRDEDTPAEPDRRTGAGAETQPSGTHTTPPPLPATAQGPVAGAGATAHEVPETQPVRTV